MTQQLRFDLQGDHAFDRESFVVSPANAEAVRALDAWPAWPGGVLALIGAAGSGKSHLGAIWALRAGATSYFQGMDPTIAASSPVLVDGADRLDDDEALFHLINAAGASGKGLLLIGRKRPSQWPSALPDLRSRLNALTVAELNEPDDGLLAALLKAYFRERLIRPADDVYPYLLRRIPRSAPAARDIVRRLDEAADQNRREINRVLARELFETDATLELFE